MTDLFPELRGLSGGKKQAWNNSNLDTIAMLYDAMGFEATCKALNMKPDTLASALERVEKRHRPALNRADKAYIRAQDAKQTADTAIRELAVQAEVFAEHINDDRELRDNLTYYFKLMEQANGLMARLCSSTSANLTEHIISPSKRKVGVTKRISRPRLLLSADRGVRQLPRPRVKKPNHFRARRPRSG